MGILFYLHLDTGVLAKQNNYQNPDASSFYLLSGALFQCL